MMPRQKPVREINSCDCLPNDNKRCDECHRREETEWTWESVNDQATTIFHNNNRNVLFNPGFSVGTVAVRGNKPLEKGYHHYWEVLFESEVYGTDVMVGVGNERTNLNQFAHSFVSLLGHDENSWGFSYTGKIQHNKTFEDYSEKEFAQYTIVGCHLDLWKGTLEFYMNRRPLGVAFKGLQDKTLYPMICSTSARSKMSLVFASSYPHSLQLESLITISRNMIMPNNMNIFTALPLPPGIQSWIKNNYWWILSSKASPPPPPKEKGKLVKPKIIPEAKKKEVAPIEIPSSSTGVKTRSMARLESLAHEGVRTRSQIAAAEEESEPTAGSSSKRVCLTTSTNGSTTKKGKPSK